MSDYIVVYGIRIAKNFIPETFGRLTAIGPRFRLSSSKACRRTYQVFECTCGEVKVLGIANVKDGSTQSCGCVFFEAVTRANTKHGMFGTVEHDTWNHMIQRCENAHHPSYLNYGGRGIAVCPEWRDPENGFQTFYDFMGPRPSPEHSIDRHPDKNGNYCPENCRWATAKEQARNRRSNVALEHNGKTQCLAAWAEETGIEYNTICSRLRRGWPVEKTLTYPVHKAKGAR